MNGSRGLPGNRPVCLASFLVNKVIIFVHYLYTYLIIQNQSHMMGRGLPISRAPLDTEIWQHYNITTLQQYNITTLQHYNITPLHHHNNTALQHDRESGEHLASEDVLHWVGVDCSEGDGGGPLVVNLHTIRCSCEM